jgi:hypothetical protein
MATPMKRLQLQYPFDRVLKPLLLAAVFAALALPLGARFEPEKVYRESPSVARRFAEPAETFSTPAFVAGKQDFTSYAEMRAFLDAVASRTNAIEIAVIGTSQQGREIPAVRFKRTGAPSRPRVLLVGQQHGNEPGGGEALLALIAMLADGRLSALTGQLDIVIVPRLNPDGAESFVRTSANGIDINRDHILLRTSEAEALARLGAAHSPHLVVDFHEFHAAGPWLSALGVLARHDITVQYAMTPGIPDMLAKAQAQLFHTPLLQSLDRKGFAHEWYHFPAGERGERTVSMGGLGAGIARNTFGLKNAVSFLLETRGIGIGRLHLARRVAAHVAAAEALLRAAADNAEALIGLKSAVEAAVAGRIVGTPVGLHAEPVGERRLLAVLDPHQGSDRQLELRWLSSLHFDTRLSRPRPLAYLLQPADRRVVEVLRVHGVTMAPVAGIRRLRVEGYRLKRLEMISRYATAAPRSPPVAVDIEPEEFAPDPGAVLVPLDQPLANIAHIILEPESPWGTLANGLIMSFSGEKLNVYRVLSVE